MKTGIALITLLTTLVLVFFTSSFRVSHADYSTSTIWFLNSDEWTSVNAYAFPNDPLGSWPGTPATQDGESNWWSVDVVLDGEFNIIFNNNNNGKQTIHIPLLNDTDVYITVLGEKFSSRAAAEASLLEQPSSEEPFTPPRKILLHYHRFEGDYDGRNVWTWNTDWEDSAIFSDTMSDFGAVFEIGVGDNAGDAIGVIIRYGVYWGDGQNDRDGWLGHEGNEKASKYITVRNSEGSFIGFNEDGIKHVFVYEGSNEVIYQDDYVGPLNEGFGTLAVIYFDPTQEYEDWNIWNWGVGTGGTSANSGPFVDTGVAFQGILGVDGQSVNDPFFMVAHFQIAPDADDEMGFIVRTDSWAKQCEEDLFIDVSSLKGSGFKTIFYTAGSCAFIDSFEAFLEVVFAVKIEHSEALDLSTIYLEFNQAIPIPLIGEGYFDPAWFTVKNRFGMVIPVLSVSYGDQQDETNYLWLHMDESYPLYAEDGPYTVLFEDGVHSASSLFSTEFMPVIEEPPHEEGLIWKSTADIIISEHAVFSSTIYVEEATELVAFQIDLFYDAMVFEVLEVIAKPSTIGSLVVNSSIPGRIRINYSNITVPLQGTVPLFEISLRVIGVLEANEYALFDVDTETYEAVRLGENYLPETIEHNTFLFEAVTVGLLGDVNGDGRISIFDVTVIQLYLADLYALTDTQQRLADVNQDGRVSILDAVYIQLYLAGLMGQLGGQGDEPSIDRVIRLEVAAEFAPEDDPDFYELMAIIYFYHYDQPNLSDLWRAATMGLLSGVSDASLVEEITAAIDIHLGVENTFYLVFAAINEFDESDMAEADYWMLAMHALLLSLEDPYSRYVYFEDLVAMQQGSQESFVGIGIRVDNANNLVRIVHVFPDSPAESAGLMPGDVITHVDGMDVREMSYEMTLSFLPGVVDSEIELGIKRPGLESIVTMTMIRAIIPTPTAVGELIEVDGRLIGSLRINTFGEQTATITEDILTSFILAGYEGLIIDVRNNTGGALTTLNALLALFMQGSEEEPFFTIDWVDRDDPQKFFSTGEPIVDVPMVLLTNGFSASASEVFASALHEQGGVEIVGETTFGKGSVQTAFQLGGPLGDYVWLTVGNWFTSAGVNVRDIGYAPSLPVAQNPYMNTPSIFIGEAVYEAGDTHELIEVAQQILKALGYGEAIELNGVLDRETVVALENFQEDHNLPVQGVLDPQTASALTQAIIRYRNTLENDKQYQGAMRVILALIAGDTLPDLSDLDSSNRVNDDSLKWVKEPRCASALDVHW